MKKSSTPDSANETISAAIKAETLSIKIQSQSGKKLLSLCVLRSRFNPLPLPDGPKAIKIQYQKGRVKSNGLSRKAIIAAMQDLADFSLAYQSKLGLAKRHIGCLRVHSASLNIQTRDIFSTVESCY